MPAVKPDQLESSLRSGRIGSLYLFDGPENWLKERAVAEIISKLVPAESKDFNLDRLDGRSATGGEIVTAMQSLPFLGERRVVVVQSTEEISAADARIVGAVLPELPASTCLVFLYEGRAGLREEIPAFVSSHGALVTFWTPFANQLPGWVIAEGKRRGKSISSDAAAMIADTCADLQQISNELDKICLFVGDKKSIDGADVRAHGLPDEIGDTKELEQALWDRNLGAALQQGRLLAEVGVRGEAIFPVCERVFRTILLGHDYVNRQKMTWEDTYVAFHARSKTAQANIMKGVKSYRPYEASRALHKIADADFDLKTGGLPSEMAVSLLLVGLCGPAKRP